MNCDGCGIYYTPKRCYVSRVVLCVFRYTVEQTLVTGIMLNKGLNQTSGPSREVGWKLPSGGIINDDKMAPWSLWITPSCTWVRPVSLQLNVKLAEDFITWRPCQGDKRTRFYPKSKNTLDKVIPNSKVHIDTCTGVYKYIYTKCWRSDTQVHRIFTNFKSQTQSCHQ